MAELIPFLDPRLVGDRFDQHSIPLEVLKDLAVLEDLIVDVAKWHFLKDNPERQRVPRGFSDQISLDVKGIGEGSAIPKIVLCIAAGATESLFPLDHRHCFEKARSSVIDAVNAAQFDESLKSILTDSHLAYFDRIGRSLRDGESIELDYKDSERPARLNRATRRKLTLSAASIQQLTEEVSLRGAICEADQRKGRFELELVDKTIIRAPIQSEHIATIFEAFKGYQNGLRVGIDGVGVFARNGGLKSIESIEQISILDVMDVGARLDELKLLRNGWLEGKGRAPKAEHLDWLVESFERFYPDELPIPYLYPTEEGGVQAEWTIARSEASLEIDLKGRTSSWHQLDLDSDDEDEAQLDLGNAKGWVKLARLLTNLRGKQGQ